MSTALDHLFHPRSLAVVGVGGRPDAIGRQIVRNVFAGGFSGPVLAVDPDVVDLPGVQWCASVSQLPFTPDLAIVAAPAEHVPQIIGDLAAKDVTTAVVISAGVTSVSGLREQMLAAARAGGMRLVGPNCLGVILPHAKLNASFAQRNAAPGDLAFISQSGAISTAVLDWAAGEAVGFSSIISAGDMADLDLSDFIDACAADPKTRAILMYVESVTDAPRFMSAARAASRLKPVIAIKAGRTAEGGKAAMTHTGALAGSFDVYEAAFRRAGILMVDSLAELFDAAEVLSLIRTAPGPRLAIVTNGGGAGILAVDAMAGRDIRLASLSSETCLALNSTLPRTWSKTNPVDIIGDAHPDRFVAALQLVAMDPDVDAILVMHCPTAVSSGPDVAAAIRDWRNRSDKAMSKPVIACWLGGPNAERSCPVLAAANIPMFDRPEDAVRAFDDLRRARRAGNIAARFAVAAPLQDMRRDGAKAIIDAARADGRTLLTEVEARGILQAYGVPFLDAHFAGTVEEVAGCAGKISPPFAVKIVSPQLPHKSDVGGVALDLQSVSAAVAAAQAMHDRVSRTRPDAKIVGFLIEPMEKRASGHEVLVGLTTDPTFGPVLMVGAGGKAVEISRDRSLGLPPLDADLAREMIDQTRISRLLAGYRDEPPADVNALVRTLQAISALATDLPEVLELDINPLLVSPDGAKALDARMRLSDEGAPARRMAIQPEPRLWTADLVTRSGLKIHVRPAHTDDEALLGEFFSHVSPEELRLRFLSTSPVVSHRVLQMMTDLDYRRTMNFLAFEDGVLIATAVLAADAGQERGEVALSVRSDRRGQGVSWTLLQHVLTYAEAQGFDAVESVEDTDSTAAIGLEREMGFSVQSLTGAPGKVLLRKVFRPEPARAPA